MRVIVQYAAQSRQAAGRSEETLEVEPGTTVAALLRVVSERHGAAMRALLVGGDDARGACRPSVVIVVGDEQVRADAPDPLREGDVVSLFPPVAGG